MNEVSHQRCYNIEKKLGALYFVKHNNMIQTDTALICSVVEMNIWQNIFIDEEHAESAIGCALPIY